jgi:hypothetical protein
MDTDLGEKIFNQLRGGSRFTVVYPSDDPTVSCADNE